MGGAGRDEGGAAGGEDVGGAERRELLGARFAVRGEEESWSRGLFAPDGDGRVGDGELDWRGRLRHGELVISDKLYNGTFGCESGIVLGGVCHESDWVRRKG